MLYIKNTKKYTKIIIILLTYLKIINYLPKYIKLLKCQYKLQYKKLLRNNIIVINHINNLLMIYILNFNKIKVLLRKRLIIKLLKNI